jgi:chorismate lyase/3-hydroxybenzoate synthase
MTGISKRPASNTCAEGMPDSGADSVYDQTQNDNSEIIINLPLPNDRHAENPGASAPLFRFSFAGTAPTDADGQLFTIALPVLDRQTISESWVTAGPVHAGEDNHIRFAAADHYLVAHLASNASELKHTERTVEDMYSRLLVFCKRQGFSHLVRTWNYLPDIHHDDGLERYRRFSVGRAHAFDATELADDRLPAGTVIGSAPGTAMSVTTLATRVPLRMVNNPRQVDAFRYPAQYGPRSPSFSRAVLLPGQPKQCLLVSGTASIVGHESLHPNDVAAQTEETCANIIHLIDEAQREQPDRTRRNFSKAAFRVYLRDPEYLEVARAIHQAHFGDAPTIYLQGDICRQELLIETEAAIWL